MKSFFSRIFAGAAAKKLLAVVLILALGAGLGAGLVLTLFRKSDAGAVTPGDSPDGGAAAHESTQPDSDGAAPDSDVDPEDPVGDPEDADPEEVSSADLQALLGGVPYYGDVSKCKMTAEQASAYAQVIADGIAGKYDMYDLWGYLTDTPEPLFWEISNDVNGYGPYKTNRANVILADLDGSGVPYLYAFSSLVDMSSYSVFGWTGSEAKFAIGDENYMGRGGSALFECDNGTVALSDFGSSGAASHGGSTYIFSNGGANKVFSWDVTLGWDDEILHVTINGKTSDYPDSTDYGAAMGAALSEDPCKPVDPETRDLPYAQFEEVESNPATLRQMLDALNNFASVMSGGKSKPVAVPEKSGTQLMAQAMLDKLTELGDPEAYVLDMNADGKPELIYYDSELNDYNILRCSGKELYEVFPEYPYDVVTFIAIVKYHDEYAFCYVGGAGASAVYYFCFLDRMDVLVDGAEFIGYDENGIPDYDSAYSYNGKEISYEEYCRLYNEYGLNNTNEVTDGLPPVKTELRRMLAG